MIEVKTLQDIEDFQKLTDIQKSAWGFTDLHAEPHYLMVRVQKYGGLVQGLFLEGEMIGFTYAVIGKWKDEFLIYSHMAAVKKEHQSKGYGFILKKAQHTALLKMGFKTVVWNFDPLESMNSYFNIHRLGATSDEFDPNIYGVGDSGLHAGLTTDRLIATWRLNSPRVIECLRDKQPATIETVLERDIDTLGHPVAYIETPVDISAIKEKGMDEAAAWRERHRRLFVPAFERGYVVEEFVFSEDRKRAFFKLIKRS